MPPAGPFRAGADGVPALPSTVRLVAAAGVLVLTLAILVGGRVPEAVQLVSHLSDKLLHACAYGVLAGCWCVALGGRRRFAAIAAAVCTGMLDEWLQRSLPGRQADVADLVADALGAVAGAWAARPVALRLQQVPAWTRAAAVYFALVFGTGFLLGTLRVPFVEPAIGARNAQLAELPLMGLAMLLVARWLVRRDRAGIRPPGWLGAGLLAAAGVLLADLAVGIVLRGMTVWEVVAGRDLVAGLAYYTLVALFALAPWVFAGHPTVRASGRVSERGSGPS